MLCIYSSVNKLLKCSIIIITENVLPPPIERPLQLVLRSQWDHGNVSMAQHILLPPFKTNEVMVVQTNTDQCESTESCIQLLQAMQVTNYIL